MMQTWNPPCPGAIGSLEIADRGLHAPGQFVAESSNESDDDDDDFEMDDDDDSPVKAKKAAPKRKAPPAAATPAPPAKKAKAAPKATAPKAAAPKAAAAPKPKAKPTAKAAPKPKPAAKPAASSSTSGGASASAPPPLTGSPQTVLLEYIQSTNRPFGAQDVFQNLHKRIPKGTVQSTLDKLADDGLIRRKEFGKAKIYVAKQARQDDDRPCLLIPP
jgi:hypothetical protein